ncbi:permease [Candidatus Caldatribacterium saccharofermentans]|uniref:permease n=1 Tax=Candidatus Caldatribacterium saccharofermentans TaxID=1454753 RepID=UPI00036595BE
MRDVVVAGFLALKDYVATHVLTCLVPAFLLAGGIVSFINREVILEYLGEKRSKLSSFSLASIASFFVAACSCTVIPVASGLYFGGATVGVAFIILWVAPATNVLALTYTGSLLGASMAFARVVAAIIMAFLVGSIMSLAFQREHTVPVSSEGGSSQPKGAILERRSAFLLFLVLLSLLLPNYLIRSGPYLHKVILWAALTAIFATYAKLAFPPKAIQEWLRETFWFVRLIFPLLLLGVFVVGVIGKLLPETWIRTWLGGNSIRSSFLATLIGAVSYFATLTEAPFVSTLMKLGMGKGPALALLLTGPGLSLPNWLAIARVFGGKKALVYVATIVLLGTVVGWFFGNFIFAP